jgi:hypothetical protein
MPLTARVERGPSEAARSREHEGQPGSLPPLPCLQAPSLSLSNGAAWLISHRARPTRAFGGRALREHRRSSGSIPSSAPGAKDRQGCPSVRLC